MTRHKQRSTRRRAATAALASAVMVLGLPAVGAHAAGGPNAAAEAKTTAGSTRGAHKATNITDGDTDTYWQAGKKSAQWVQTDLGKTKRVRQVVLRLPEDWQTRKQTRAPTERASRRSSRRRSTSSAPATTTR